MEQAARGSSPPDLRLQYLHQIQANHEVRSFRDPRPEPSPSLGSSGDTHRHWGVAQLGRGSQSSQPSRVWAPAAGVRWGQSGHGHSSNLSHIG